MSGNGERGQDFYSELDLWMPFCRNCQLQFNLVSLLLDLWKWKKSRSLSRPLGRLSQSHKNSKTAFFPNTWYCFLTRTVQYVLSCQKALLLHLRTAQYPDPETPLNQLVEVGLSGRFSILGGFLFWALSTRRATRWEGFLLTRRGRGSSHRTPGEP